MEGPRSRTGFGAFCVADFPGDGGDSFFTCVRGEAGDGLDCWNKNMHAIIVRIARVVV